MNNAIDRELTPQQRIDDILFECALKTKQLNYSDASIEARNALLALISQHTNSVLQEVLPLIDYFDFVEPCEPDCSPERHAYHQGQWDMAGRMNKALGLNPHPHTDEEISEALKPIVEGMITK